MTYEISDRNKTILKYAQRGKKKADIARMFKLSRQRIFQIVKKQEPKEDPLTLY